MTNSLSPKGEGAEMCNILIHRWVSAGGGKQARMQGCAE